MKRDRPVAAEVRAAPEAGGAWTFLTVDVEAFWHVHALAPWVPEGARVSWPLRLTQPLERLLLLLAEAGVRATFFVLGEVAARAPELVRAIVAAGHELACHGHAHRPLWRETPATFRADITRAKALLEDAAGVMVRGYRAPSFSLRPEHAWAMEVLGEVGFAYSSSRHAVPGRTRVGREPRRVVRIRGLLEIPVPTRLGLPFAGGAWMRLWPEALWRRLVRGFRPRPERPLVAYLHPWELDPAQPRLPGLPWRTRLRHYGGLAGFDARLRWLLRQWHWRPLAAELETFHRLAQEAAA